MNRVYAVCDDAHDPDTDHCWTISEHPRRTGWETDSGCDGYGLTKAIAEEYVRAINLYRGYTEETT